MAYKLWNGCIAFLVDMQAYITRWYVRKEYYLWLGQSLYHKANNNALHDIFTVRFQTSNAP